MITEAEMEAALHYHRRVMVMVSVMVMVMKLRLPNEVHHHHYRLEFNQQPCSCAHWPGIDAPSTIVLIRIYYLLFDGLINGLVLLCDGMVCNG
jgi:hypothetical protein